MVISMDQLSNIVMTHVYVKQEQPSTIQFKLFGQILRHIQGAVNVETRLGIFE